jgi:hypothetical protein
MDKHEIINPGDKGKKHFRIIDPEASQCRTSPNKTGYDSQG